VDPRTVRGCPELLDHLSLIASPQPPATQLHPSGGPGAWITRGLDGGGGSDPGFDSPPELSGTARPRSDAPTQGTRLWLPHRTQPGLHPALDAAWQGSWGATLLVLSRKLARLAVRASAPAGGAPQPPPVTAVAAAGSAILSGQGVVLVPTALSTCANAIGRCTSGTTTVETVSAVSGPACRSRPPAPPLSRSGDGSSNHTTG